MSQRGLSVSGLQQRSTYPTCTIFSAIRDQLGHSSRLCYIILLGLAIYIDTYR